MSCIVEELVAALEEAARLNHEAKHFILGNVDRERFPSYLACPYWPCHNARAVLEKTREHDCIPVDDAAEYAAQR